MLTEQLSRRIRFGESPVLLGDPCMRLNIRSRLWEPGYRERYYRQKFGVEHTDQEFKKKYVLILCHKRLCS
jgi:Xrn1 helical domain